MNRWWKCALVGVVFLIRQGSCLSPELAALQKEYGEWRLQRSPEYATTIGVYKHNDQVENYAYYGFVEEYNKCLGLLTRLREQVYYNQLDAKEKIDYDIFNDTLTMIVEGNNWKDYSALNPVNFLEGPQIDPTYLSKTTPFDTVGDYENYIRRLELHSAQGWGLYAEYLGEEMKLYKTDYDLMGRYGFEIFRASRLVVDTGLHYYNWTREKAIEYMLNYTAFSEEMIAIEIDRYITWPGQACAYKIGELKIKELRKKAEDKLGSKFHATVLKSGYLPLHILEKNVNQWILETKNKAAESVTKCASNGANTYTSWIGLTVIALILFLQ